MLNTPAFGPCPAGRFKYCLVLFVVFITCSAVLLPRDSFALWPFSTQPKEPYVARVDDRFITPTELLTAMDRRHKSGRAGRSLSKTKSFDRQDFRKLLNEIIDDELVQLEAENLELDKAPDFVRAMENYSLNLSLDRLRQDEVVSGVKVEEGEIEKYWERIQELGGGAPKEEPRVMTPADRWQIERKIRKKNIGRREQEYFVQLRQGASVKIDEEALASASPDDAGLLDGAVAYIGREPVTARELFKEMEPEKRGDYGERKKKLESLVVYRLLDREALRRGYDKEPKVAAKIERYRGKALIDHFKRKIVLRMVEVKEEDISDYYEKNRENYRQPNRVKLKVIHLNTFEEAEVIYDDLKKGADFTYLAKKKSVDTRSGAQGGDMGWAPVTVVPEGIRAEVEAAERGAIFGPFEYRYGYSILKVLGHEEGGYTALKDVRRDIEVTIGRERFHSTLRRYLDRLREVVAVEINEAELEKFVGK
ncbi:MAG: peptidyl-prolyl cis-trans isomerase [Thermodesulfobacteriota bacterium]